jgi:hypothetical protein
MCLLLNDCFVLHAYSSQDGSAYVRASRQECVVPPPPPLLPFPRGLLRLFCSLAHPARPQRLVIPLSVPDNPLFSPSLNITAFDSRLGGFLKPDVGVCLFLCFLHAVWPVCFGCWGRAAVCTAMPLRSLSPPHSLLSVSGPLRKHVLTRPPLSFTGSIDMQAWRP